MQVVYLLNVYYWQSRADYILLSAIYSLFGGDTTFLIGMYSFLADITTTDTRTSRSGHTRPLENIFRSDLLAGLLYLTHPILLDTPSVTSSLRLSMKVSTSTEPSEFP